MTDAPEESPTTQPLLTDAIAGAARLSRELAFLYASLEVTARFDPQARATRHRFADAARTCAAAADELARNPPRIFLDHHIHRLALEHALHDEAAGPAITG